MCAQSKEWTVLPEKDAGVHCREAVPCPLQPFLPAPSLVSRKDLFLLREFFEIEAIRERLGRELYDSCKACMSPSIPWKHQEPSRNKRGGADFHGSPIGMNIYKTSSLTFL